MCGRYSLIAAIGDLEGLFDFVFGDTDYTPSYNIAPTQRVLTVVGAMPRRGGFMRWGLTPRSLDSQTQCNTRARCCQGTPLHAAWY